MAAKILSHSILISVLIAVSLNIGCASTRPLGQQVDDGGITAKITAKLAADPEVNPFNIDVDTLEGVVTLRGEVEKDVARTEAEKLARNTKGVKEVRNEIRVASEEDEEDHSHSDAWITTKIKTKLAADPELNPFNIDVDTEDGRVTLSGKVKSDASRQEAEKLARNTAGVVEVINELQTTDGP